MPDNLYPPVPYQPPPAQPTAFAAPGWTGMGVSPIQSPYDQSAAAPIPTKGGSGAAFRRVHWTRVWPGVVSAIPLALGREWSTHGGHSLAAWGVGGLAVTGLAMAVAVRHDAHTAAAIAGLSALTLDFAICAYSTEWYLPLGLTGLAAATMYAVAAKAWARVDRRASKHQASSQLELIRANTTVQTAQIEANSRIAIAAIQAQAQVRVAETQAIALTAIHAPYPVMELSPTAKAMLDRSPRLAIGPAESSKRTRLGEVPQSTDGPESHPRQIGEQQ